MQTAAVTAFLAPIVERYTITLTTHNAVSDRIDRMLRSNYWTPDDSAAFKQDIAYETKLTDELTRASRDMEVATDLLVALFGEVDAQRQFPELWSLNLEGGK